MMELTLDQKHENRITFKGEVPVALANLIRRYCMMHVPVVAIDKLTFYENTTALFDEYIAHRIGLLPIATPDRTSDKSEIAFRLDETGPKVVYSKDLKSADTEIVPAREEIPIATLTDGQRLRLEGAGKVGIGTQHAKYQAGLMSYSLEGKEVQFMVESFYQMTPAEVVKRGCSVLIDDLKELTKQLEKSEKPKKKKK